jgi:aspartyl-tRNA(Asn)/glutamyl-tRNA(Gln) amidotransferase subunit A
MRAMILQEFFPREVTENSDVYAKTQLESLQQVMSYLEEKGGKVAVLSVPSIPLALHAYYIISSAEASSNLSRYDGYRFGPSKVIM